MPVAPKATPKPVANTQTVIAASPATAPRKPTALQKPVAPSVTLAGTVAVDAGYVVKAGAGTVVDGHLIANNGGSVLANNSSNLIANNGGSVISDHGGAIISDHAAGRRVLADDAATYGAVLPAAGMELGVRSLVTGKPIPVGVDDAGKPVYSIYTNKDGAYEVYVPAEEQGNVLLEAQIPQTKDPRQRYEVIARPATKAAKVVDEDTAQITRYMREAFVARIYGFFTVDPDVTICSITASPAFPPEFKTVLKGTLPEVRSVAAAAGITASEDQRAAVQALAARCADIVIAQVDLEAVVLGTTTIFWGNKPGEGPEPAVPAAVTVVRAFRETATKVLAKDPGFFEDQSFFRIANACKPGTYVIKKPSDATAFVVSEYMTDNRVDALSWADTVINTVGTPRDANGIEPDRRLNAAGIALAQRVALAFFGDEGGSKATCLELMRHFDRVNPLGEGVPFPPAKPLTCPHQFADGYSEDGCATGAPIMPR
ncbi:MAG: hypothetical protein JWM80_346 [Cyanobacteria bacterium RYN_339]|nr:hypothetical protein [Cyanobacteria bacterium RYN_339]